MYLFIVWAKGPPGGLGTIRETFLQTSVHVLYVNCVNGTGIESLSLNFNFSAVETRLFWMKQI